MIYAGFELIKRTMSNTKMKYLANTVRVKLGRKKKYIEANKCVNSTRGPYEVDVFNGYRVITFATSLEK